MDRFYKFVRLKKGLRREELKLVTSCYPILVG